MTADVPEVVQDEVEPFLLAQRPQLLAVALSVLEDYQLAEDACQETLLTAWAKWNTLRDPEARPAWLRTVCVRECLRLRRRMAADLRRRTRLAESMWARAADAGSEDSIWDDAFSVLSTRQRAIVLLHYTYGYTLDECASTLGVRPGTARRHLSRALDRLRVEVKQ